MMTLISVGLTPTVDSTTENAEGYTHVEKQYSER